MNQGTQGYSLMKKTEGRKSRDTVPLSSLTSAHISGRLNSGDTVFGFNMLYNRRGLARSDSEFMRPEMWALEPEPLQKSRI
jgi:hypothetical protein